MKLFEVVKTVKHFSVNHVPTLERAKRRLATGQKNEFEAPVNVLKIGA